MTVLTDPVPATRAGHGGAARLALAGWAAMMLAYAAIFALFGDGDVWSALQRALINTLPAAFLSWPIAILIERRLIGAHPAVQLCLHVGLALCFAVLWYIGIQVGYGLQSGWASGGIVGRPLLGVALTWQSFQGVTLYAVIAGYAYAAHYRRELTALRERLSRDVPDASVPATRTVFVKDGKAIRPVALSDILLLSGAGDYTEVATRNGTYLSSASLDRFEADLPTEGFLRVHRSHIVRTDAVLSVESGGNGRLTLHLPSGRSVTTSRAGAGRFRGRAL
ncbi:LytTR family DNA-binding domain-containing protein [uncultured Algimonas sp.]|uniref:LytR/AlgR family response regulator transcription factor n=1 Tax=uncultured Algimonas sp. TaxID=1547920 RepID=UPI0026317C17|nr:LytTR family DNA-binding domain-containing protein [uncultured Algimonas sp.]